MARLRAWVLVPLIALAVLTTGSAALASSQAASGLTFTPSPARAGQDVTTTVDLTGAVQKEHTICGVRWDDTRITATCQPAQDGVAKVEVGFAVPTDATRGTHRVVVIVLGTPFEGTLDVVGLLAVPDLVTLTLSQAKQRVKGVGLTLCEAPVGIVVSQTPRPGTFIDPATCVRVVTKPAVVMPNLLGKTLADARAIVEANGLVLTDPHTTDGTVSQQDPAPGVRVFRGSAVSVRLTAVHLVTVPDLVGHTVRDATSTLSAGGLRLRGGGSDPEQLVKTQNPGPGARVAPGSQVSVTLLPTPPIVVPVPDLRGMTLDQARTALASAQLTLMPPASDAAGDARIASQSPTAGARVPPGSTIAVTLEASTPWPPSGLLTAGAIAALGLAIGVRRLIRRVRTTATTGTAHPPPPPPAPPPPPPPVVVLRPRADIAVDVQVLEADDASASPVHLDAHLDRSLDPTIVEVPS